MCIFKKEKLTKFGVFDILAAAGLLSLTLLITSLVLDTDVSAQENKEGQEEAASGKIFNLFGSEMGSVDAEGNVTNISGIFLGSIDDKGTILNVSKMNIGKVTEDGKVLNQSGTVLGSVNASGEIFNVSGRKVGEVKDETDINKTGAAARLIVLKGKGK